MKSCSKYTEVFKIKNKTLLITIIFVVVLVVLYFAYKPSMFMYKTASNNGNNGNKNGNQSNQHQPKNKINNLLNKGSNLLNDTLILTDKFEDTPIEFNDLTPEQQEIVITYRDFFNGATKKEISDFYNENETSIDDNLATLISNYNNYNEEVNKTIEEINYDLLRQLQRNYALAHKVNSKRNIELQDIDNLPQRFD